MKVICFHEIAPSKVFLPLHSHSLSLHSYCVYFSLHITIPDCSQNAPSTIYTLMARGIIIEWSQWLVRSLQIWDLVHLVKRKHAQYFMHEDGYYNDHKKINQLSTNTHKYYKIIIDYWTCRRHVTTVFHFETTSASGHHIHREKNPQLCVWSEKIIRTFQNSVGGGRECGWWGRVWVVGACVGWRGSWDARGDH